jgi:hypothetical protein
MGARTGGAARRRGVSQSDGEPAWCRATASSTSATSRPTPVT